MRNKPLYVMYEHTGISYVIGLVEIVLQTIEAIMRIVNGNSFRIMLLLKRDARRKFSM